jgi:hypothetical protein
MRAEDAIKDLTDPNNFKPGLYRHHKGHRYVATQLVRHHETRALFVVYISTRDGSSHIREWATPGEDSWVDMVPLKDAEGNATGEMVPRFKPVSPAY